MDTRFSSRLLWVALATSLLAGCADVTSLMVEVTSSDLAVPADVDELRFEVRSATGRSVDRRFAIDGPWPHSLAVLPASSADGAVVLTVTGLSGGAPVVRRVIETAFIAGLERKVEVRLERACLGVQCADGVDCVAGACVAGGSDGGVDAGVEPTDGGSDAGVDAGRDAGATDGGRPDDGGSTDGGLDGGPTDAGPIDGGGPLPCASAACPIRISEFATRGPAGDGAPSGDASNEFVEIYNPSSSAYSLDGVELYYHSSGGTASRRVTITGDASIAPHGFFLLASRDYTGVAPDFSERWATGFADGGGSLELRAGGERVDLVGWGTATVAEGSPFTPAISTSAGTAGASYERKAHASSTSASMAIGGADETAGNGYDSDDNATDIVIRTTRQPQNSSSPAEP